MQTVTKNKTEYIEPIGFKGTKGQWVMAGINGGIAIKERSLAERGFSDRIAVLYSPSSENIYNAQLMMLSKELVKELQDIVDISSTVLAIMALERVERYDIAEKLKNKLLYSTEVLNKALNG